MEYIEIKTERLVLKPLGIKYLDTVNEYAVDKENTRYMLYLPNETAEETVEIAAEEMGSEAEAEEAAEEANPEEESEEAVVAEKTITEAAASQIPGIVSALSFDFKALSISISEYFSDESQQNFNSLFFI